jgi:hypothetical protein
MWLVVGEVALSVEAEEVLYRFGLTFGVRGVCSPP